MTAAANGGDRLGPLVYLSQNWISRIGILLATTGGVAWLFSLPLHLSGEQPNPYLGLLTFLALPAVFFLGLILIPLGIRLKQRREKAAGVYPRDFPPPRWSNPAFRRLLSFVVLATAANVIIGGHLTYSAVEYMDSTSFCGQACHIMTPEFTAWQAAPHAGVRCVECHIGEGAGSFVHAKLNGTRQLLLVMTGAYRTPVPTPVHNLAQGNLTCERCHRDADLGRRRVEWVRYAPDELNTPTRTELRHAIGGGDNARGSHGAHMAGDARVEYRSDPARATIPWIRYISPAGEETVYATADWNPARADELELRTMDCVDCHNRAAHSFESPERAIDRAIDSGAVSAALPFIKREGLAAITAAYSSQEEAGEEIAQSIEAVYGGRAAADEIRAAVEALVAIYSRNVFPKWGVQWRTHPNLNGHDEPGGDQGCFRCHSQRHISQDEAGKPVGDDCGSCHDILALDQLVESDEATPDGSQVSRSLPIPTINLASGSPAGAVAFDHDRHVGFAEGACAVCHDRLFAMARTESVNYAAGLHKVAERNRTSCAWCHVEGGSAFASAGSCGRCHAGLTQSEGPPPAQPTQPALPSQIRYETALGPTAFDHAEHLELTGGECRTCHNRLFTMTRGALGYGGLDLHAGAEAAGASCAGCHVADGVAFAAEGNCANCHSGLETPRRTPTSGRSALPAIPTVDTALGEAKFGHALHSELVGGDCSACHTATFPFERGLLNYGDDLHRTAEANATSCGACHRSEGVAFPSAGNCSTCHTRFGPSAGMPSTILYENRLANVSFNHELHSDLAGGDCSSCHNDLFDMAISDLTGYADDYHRRAETEGALCAACHAADGAAFGALNNCSRCHQGLKIRETNPNAGV